MMRDEVFWNRVNAALDEHRDPLADELVQDELARRPERLDRLLALRRRLAALPPERARRRIGPLVAACAAASVVLGTALAWWLATRPTGEPADGNGVVGSTDEVAAAPRAGEVLDFQLTITLERPGSLARVTAGPHGVVRELASGGEVLVRASSTIHGRPGREERP